MGLNISMIITLSNRSLKKSGPGDTTPWLSTNTPFQQPSTLRTIIIIVYLFIVTVKILKQLLLNESK